MRGWNNLELQPCPSAPVPQPCGNAARPCRRLKKNPRHGRTVDEVCPPAPVSHISHTISRRGCDPPLEFQIGERQRRRAEQHQAAEMRAAQVASLEPTTVSLYRTIFPQMTNWLPDDEGAQLRFQFEEELARLEAA